VIACLNGRFLPADEAAIPIADRGFLHADGVFETALLHQGRYFRLANHLDRFAASAALMRLDLPPLHELHALATELAHRNRADRGTLRIILTRGAAAPTLLLTLTPPDTVHHARAKLGWRLVTAATRRPSPAAVPAQLKALGRPWAILARQEAAAAGADDVLLLTDSEIVCEGPSWNVFWRKGDVLYTPAVDAGVLAGITRATILELAPSTGLAVREGLFPRVELDGADEIFATMTSVGVVPVLSLDGRSLPSATPAAHSLRTLYRELLDYETSGRPS
jgi:branched-chain amino acid aminotransferase